MTDARAWPLLHGLSLLLCAVAAVLHWRSLGGPLFTLDDAYIVLVNAQALLDGAPPAGEGPLILGGTSLLHTLATAAAAALLGPETGLWVLCWLGVAAAASGALAMGRAAGAGPAWAAGLAVAALIGGFPSYVLINGLETSWVLAALFWTFRCALRDDFSPAAAVLCGLLPFIRPELGVFSAAVMLRMAAIMGRDGGRERARAWRAAALCVAPALALLALQYALSGAPLPTTGSAKRLVFGPAWQSLPERASDYAAALSGFFAGTGLMGAGVLFARGSLQRAVFLGALALMLASAAWYGKIVHQNGDRLLWEFLPPLALFLATGAAAPLRSAPGALARGAILGSLLLLAPTLPARWDRGVELAIGGTGYERRVADWIDANIPPGGAVMVHDVGYVSWATDARIIDFVGLRSPENIAVHRRATAREGWTGAATAAVEIMERERVCTFIIMHAWDEVMGLTEELRRRGWTPVALTPPDNHAFHAFEMQAPAGSASACAT
ncbi:hypothetical protein ACQ5SO_04760 [Rhodovulum sp. DZ06]|uniref:hypothetical protein n=1 Tax=Rhodovulum sp. DZ06 TaxID=3425126 RepID=UPI003D33A1FF